VFKANVFEPLGMSSSSYVWNATFETRVARPHDSNGTPLPAHHPTPTDAARYASSGALLSTPTDYANFLIEVMNPTESDPFRLAKATRDEMVRPVVKVPDGPRRARGRWGGRGSKPLRVR